MQGNEPFFSNNLEGWLKVGGFFIAIVSFVGIVMAKLVSNAFSKRLENVERETNTSIERRARIDSKVEDHERRLIVAENDVKGLHDSYDRIDAGLVAVNEKLDDYRNAQSVRDEKLADKLGGLSAKVDILLQRTETK
jgi:chromosome segregation ATPase